MRIDTPQFRLNSRGLALAGAFGLSGAFWVAVISKLV